MPQSANDRPENAVNAMLNDGAHVNSDVNVNVNVTEHGDELLIFSDAESALPTPNVAEHRPWRVLVVDDEPDVHAVTRFALRDVSFKGRPLELLSAFSAAEGFEVLSRETDIALIFLDVVMETEHAGLDLAKRIREEMNNHVVRIVLRTGQPGQAPEENVIVDYDINDYKAKSELTVQKMFTTVISSLRAYDGLLMIERNRLGLTKILQASSNLYEMHSLREFASGVLNQVGAILDVGAHGALCVLNDTRRGPGMAHASVVAGTGSYADLTGLPMLAADHPLTPLVVQVFRDKVSLFQSPIDVLYGATQLGYEFAVLVRPSQPLSAFQHELLAVYCERISAAFDNYFMYDQMRRAQEATVMALAELAECRNAGVGGRVMRVCRLTEAMARELAARGPLADQITPNFIAMIGLATVLYDLGKSTPLSGASGVQHEPSEAVRDQLQGHALSGRRVLVRAIGSADDASCLFYAAQIAESFHERVDGSGFPLGLVGDAIPLAARLVAVADAFDGLLGSGSNAGVAQAQASLLARRGTALDALVVDALLAFVERVQPAWLLDNAQTSLR